MHVSYQFAKTGLVRQVNCYKPISKFLTLDAPLLYDKLSNALVIMTEIDLAFVLSCVLSAQHLPSVLVNISVPADNVASKTHIESFLLITYTGHH